MNMCPKSLTLVLSLRPSQRKKRANSNMFQGLQDLNETRVAKLNSVWSLAAELENSYLAKSMDHLLNLLNEIPRNSPHLDSHMFLRHNVTQSQEPTNLT